MKNYILHLFIFLITQSNIFAFNKDSLISEMEWRGIGPDRGGRSLAVSGSPSRINEYYFGAVGGGLWKTTDGGQTWYPVTDGQISRFAEKKENLFEITGDKIMTKNPISIDKDSLAVKALNLMNEKKITSLCVHSKKNKKRTIGILHIHTLLASNTN